MYYALIAIRNDKATRYDVWDVQHPSLPVLREIVSQAVKDFREMKTQVTQIKYISEKEYIRLSEERILHSVFK